MTRSATQIDRDFKAKLEALQIEQRSLNRRVKAHRERSEQITSEFYAAKSEWKALSGDNNLTIIVW